MNIAEYIPRGRENAITRRELSRLTGIPDRQLRDLIKRANRELAGKGEAILSSSNRAGYWISGDVGEMRRYLRESNHRIKPQLTNDLPIRQIVDGVNQVVLVRAHVRRLHAKKPEPAAVEGQEAFW